MEIKMVKTTYYFDFEERIPDRELEKIILITRSGFSYDGKLSKNYENEEKKNSFSLLNILIFSSLFIYIPVIVRINVVWNNIDKIFMETTVKIMEIFPLNDDSSRENVIKLLFISILITIIFMSTTIVFANFLFYFHLKIIFRCSEWANKNLLFYN